MSTPRRPLGTGPHASDPDQGESAGTRLLPVERADVGEYQEHDDARTLDGRGPVPGRRKLGTGGQQRGTASSGYWPQ